MSLVTLPGRRGGKIDEPDGEFIAAAWHVGYKTQQEQKELWRAHLASERGVAVALIHYHNNDINVTDRTGTKWKGKLQTGPTTQWDYNTGDLSRFGCQPALQAPPRPAMSKAQVEQQIANVCLEG